jgi:uncharacterized membrane protein YedE/YeeE
MSDLVNAAFGGLMIGAAAAGLLLLNGRIAGISSILANAFRPGRTAWQWAFLAGLVGAGLAARLAGFGAPATLGQENPLVLALGGLLVGFGTRLSSGCTSGHGVCGLANLSPRSLAATLTFMAVAGLTVFVIRHA